MTLEQVFYRADDWPSAAVDTNGNCDSKQPVAGDYFVEVECELMGVIRLTGTCGRTGPFRRSFQSGQRQVLAESAAQLDAPGNSGREPNLTVVKVSCWTIRFCAVTHRLSARRSLLGFLGIPVLN